MDKKLQGKVYTPPFIVKNVLDLAQYDGDKILKKHIIDNSCGDGAFLCEIVRRYCENATLSGFDRAEISKDLAKFIHGIEINADECQKAVRSLDRVAAEFGLGKIRWDICCDDALSVRKFDSAMDFVVGNPPYIRVHNFGEKFNTIKSFEFAKSGMSDLFIVFYEIALKMLNKTGVLSYITPSSLFNSLAAKNMRSVFVSENLIQKICNLRHFQAFENATTYTAICVLKKQNSAKKCEFYEYDMVELKPKFCDYLSTDEFYLNENFYFDKAKNLANIQEITRHKKQSEITVKNGFATLCDSVFIGDFDRKSRFLIDIIKASKGTTGKAIYPYDKNGNVICESELKNDEIYKHLTQNKSKLQSRSLDKNTPWYAYGRSQAINDTYKDKIAINTLIRDISDIKLTMARCGVGVYSGLYIIANDFSFSNIQNAIKSCEFIDYIKALGKYKSGGYYTFSSKDLKLFLDYKFGK